MAEIFSAPDEVGPPPSFDDFKPDFRALMDAEEAWIGKVREWCREHGGQDLAGEEIRFQIADGYARYVVHSLDPAQLVWINTGDAYAIDPVWERGLEGNDIRERVEQQRKISEIFGSVPPIE